MYYGTNYTENFQLAQERANYIPANSDRLRTDPTDRNLKLLREYENDEDNTDIQRGILVHQLRWDLKLKDDDDNYDLDSLWQIYTAGQKLKNPTDINEPKAYYLHLHDLKTQSQQNAVKYSADRENWKTLTPERKAEILKDNPDYEERISRDKYIEARHYLNHLAKDDKKFVFEFISASENRSVLVDNYTKKLFDIASSAPERYNDIVNAIDVLNPSIKANFLSRGFDNYIQNLADDYDNYKFTREYTQQGVNKYRMYEVAQEFGGIDKVFDADGNYLPDMEAKVNARIEQLKDAQDKANEETSMTSSVMGTTAPIIFERDKKKYSAKEVFDLMNEGAEFMSKSEQIDFIRNTKRTKYDESSGFNNFASNVITTLLDSGTYAGATMALTALTKNPYVANAIVGKVMFERAYNRNIKDFTTTGKLSYAQAKGAAMYASAVEAVAEIGENILNVRLAGSSTYLLKTAVKDITAGGVMRAGWKGIIGEYFASTAGEFGTEVIQNVNNFFVKEYLRETYGAEYANDENVAELSDSIWQALITTPFITGAFSGVGAFRANAEVRRATGRGLISGVFASEGKTATPKDFYTNQARASGAMAQAEQAAQEFATKYDGDFISKFNDVKGDENAQNELIDSTFDEATRAEVRADIQKLKEIETQRHRTSERLISDAVQKHVEATNSLKAEAATENMLSSAELESAVDEKMSLVNDFISQYGNSENVVIVEDVADLPKNVSSNMGGAKASFNAADGKIYFVKNRVNNKYDALSTLVHENTHFVYNLLKDNQAFTGLFAEAVNILGGESGIAYMRAALPETYRNLDDEEIVEEYMARVCERVILGQMLNKPQKGIWANIKAFFKSWVNQDDTIAENIDKSIAEIGKRIFEVSTAQIKTKNEELKTKNKNPPKTDKTDKINDSGKPKKKKSLLPEKVRNGIETLANRIGKADLNIGNDYRLAEDFAEAVKIFELALPKKISLAEFLLTKDGKQFKNASETALQLAEYLVKDKGNFKGINAILRKYSQSAEALDRATIPDIAGYQKPNKTALLNLAKNKHVWSNEELRIKNEELKASDGELSAEGLDFKKQIAEVRVKYENTPMWLKAPNGQPTKLTQEQWLAVRTPNFKRWFGDWEKEAWAKAAMDFLENTNAVALLTGNEFQKDGVKLTDKVSAYFKSIGNVANNKELGDVVLDFRGIKDSMGHGIGRAKATAFMAVKDVIEKGFIFNRETNWKGRGYDTAVITAPIKIGNSDYVCEVVLIKAPSENKFYLHEVETKETLESLFKTTTEGAKSQVSRLILGKHIQEVKKNVSKVIDENGEPLVVYHGSDNTFFVFDRTKSRANADIQGNFFSPWEEDAQGYGANVRAFFLNIKNPANEISGYGALKKFSGQNQRGIKAREELIAQGYDGVNNEDAEFIAFNSNQIKSATDNIGIYSENPDIRYSDGELMSDFEFVPEMRDESFIKEILKDFGEPIKIRIGESFKNADTAVDVIYKSLKSSEKPPKNDDTGWDIHISKDEVKKFINIKPKSAWSVLYSLREIIKRAKYDGIRPDRHGRNNVIYHRFFVNVKNAKRNTNSIPAVLSVREILDQDGYKKYYDLSLVSNERRADTDREDISQPRFSSTNSSLTSSKNRPESQGNNLKKSSGELSTDGLSDRPDLKYIIEQSPESNPIAYASMQFAKFTIINGGKIPQTLIDRLLPLARFSEFQRSEALEMGAKIAERINAKKQRYADELALNAEIKRTQSDLYWQDVVNRIANEFTETGEWFGRTFAISEELVKNANQQRLKFIKGYEAQDFDVNLVQSLIDAQVDEERKMNNEETGAEVEGDLDFGDDTLNPPEATSKEQEILSGLPIKEIFARIREEVLAKERTKGAETEGVVFGEVLRKTYINVLNNLSKELNYGIGRERIKESLANFANVKYHSSEDLTNALYEIDKLKARIKETKDANAKKDLRAEYFDAIKSLKEELFGYGPGTASAMNFLTENYDSTNIPDNFTIFAESIALRSYRRKVKEDKYALFDKFLKIIKRKGKKPTRMERDDKRRISGAVQMRIYKIGKFAFMTPEELEKEFYSATDKLNNVDAHFAGINADGNVEFSDIEDTRAEVANTIADIQIFGNLREKTRGEMKHAVDFLENYIEEEMRKQQERVAEKKAEAASKRKIFINALRMSKHNAHKDGIIRRAGRGLLNQTMPFDSYLAMLGEYSTGKTFEAFTTFCKNLLAKIDRASANVANETFQAQQALQRITVECYGGNFSDALKRLLKPDARYEEFSNSRGENGADMKQPMTLANVMQLYASATQENYVQNVYAHRAIKNAKVDELQARIDNILFNFPDWESKHGEEWEKASQEIKDLEAQIHALQKDATSVYIARLEKVLTPADKKFVELLRQQYADALPALSAVAKRVIGLPIEQADVLYMPVKVKRAKSFGESVGQVPVIPKVLSPRVPHLRDFDETADPISLFLDRVRENAQFKYFSEIYIELRSIFGNEELQDLISQRCGQNTLQGLLDFISDISSGQTRGFKNEWIQKANGLYAITALGFNLGSGVRQLLPGCFSWGTYIGTPTVLKNIATFFTPEGYAAAKEIWKSENGRRRFTIGNLQIMEEMLATPDQNKFWAFYKRHSLFFNRASDMIAISVVGQGVYRTGIESYLRQGFNIDKAREMAMADMWQIAERTQASGRMHNMAQWQRRGGDLGKAIGMFSAPPQLMFAKSLQDIRRAIALGVKTPEGRAAAWRAIKTWATVSVLVEGSYAFSGVMWNAFLKGFFEEDDDERIFKQMATGPFGGLFLFGRIIEGSSGGYSSVIPIEGFKRPIKNIYDIALDVATLDIEKAPEDLNKLAKALFSPWRDAKKAWDEREIGEKLSDVFD